MKRPHITNFIAVQTGHSLHLRTSITMREDDRQTPPGSSLPFSLAQNILVDQDKDSRNKTKASFPIQAYRMLRGHHFTIKVCAIDEQGQLIFEKIFESDRVGSFNFKIPFHDPEQHLKALQIYEISERSGVELYLGSFIPLIIKGNKKIVICDFDKTLVDTKYSTTREVYTSLTRPIDYFPTVTNSVDLIKQYIDQGFHPFILSASPHFYENAMRDWLYQNQIYTAGIFLKDYRHIFNLLELDLTTKDLKVQGMYKINHLLDILLIVGIPDELVLIGDNFESDPIIYLALASLLKGTLDSWNFINLLDQHDSFLMNKKQKAQLLSKSYQINTKLNLLAQKRGQETFPNIKIHIRKKVREDVIEVPDSLKTHLPCVELYEGLPLKTPAIVEEQKEQ